MRTIILLLAAALLPLAAKGAAQIVDPTTGNPLVDGPGPYKRLPARPLDRSRPLVIGHRGSSGEYPEHSELAYRAAVNHGAQFIECCDIVLTADLVPICRHEPLISGTTNANEVFPDRVRTYNVDGENTTGVHAIDLTLAEIKTLRVKERLDFRSQAFNGFLPVMTFEECATMAKEFYTKEGIVVGIYPETKHPTWHDTFVAQRWPQLLRRYRDQVAPRLGPWAAIQGPGASAASNSRSDARLREGEDRGRGKGRDKEKENEDDDYKKKGLPRPPTITDIVLEVAHRLGYNNDISSSKWSRQPIFLQSFEVNNLKYAFQRTKMPITQLTDDTFAKLPDKSYPNYGALLADMSNIARYAKGLGPYKATLLTNYDTNTGDIRAGPAGDSGIVTRAHTAGLQVHLYTLRNEPRYLPPFSSIDEEYNYYFKTLGVDGGFTDFPGTLVPWTRAKAPWAAGKWVQS